MSERKHTELPWRWVKETVQGRNQHVAVRGGAGALVLGARFTHEGESFVYISESDAAFIVKAANSHEAMKTALRKAVGYFGGLSDDPDNTFGPLHDDDAVKVEVLVRIGDLRQFRTALKEAEG